MEFLKCIERNDKFSNSRWYTDYKYKMHVNSLNNIVLIMTLEYGIEDSSN